LGLAPSTHGTTTSGRIRNSKIYKFLNLHLPLTNTVSGFFIGRDGGTEKLAIEVAEEIKKRFSDYSVLAAGKCIPRHTTRRNNRASLADSLCSPMAVTSHSPSTQCSLSLVLSTEQQANEPRPQKYSQTHSSSTLVFTCKSEYPQS